MNGNHYVLIMAGGVGSRFWPISRLSMPKQFLDVLGRGKTLIQETYDRFREMVPPENIYVLTNEAYADLVCEQLALGDKSRIISEPVMRNTAPCIAYACHKIQALNPKAVMVIAPSDHLITYPQTFARDIESALYVAANHPALLTLGITPSRPDTGYGYIHCSQEGLSQGFRKVQAFIEKPGPDAAREYLASGNYLWNAGIFVWHVNVALAAFSRFEPEMHALFLSGTDLYNTPAEDQFMRDTYPMVRNISVDYAVMERAENVYVLPTDFGWSDLGTWASVYEHAPKDEWQNVHIAVGGQSLLYDTENCLVNLPGSKRVVIKGLNNYVVAEANDTLFIYPMADEQGVKEVVGDVKLKFGDSFI